MRLKRLVALALAGTMALSLAACGGNNNNNASTSANNTQASADSSADGDSKEPVTIKFSWWGGDSRHEATLAAIEKFQEKYDWITVETQYGAWSGWEDSMATAFSTGTAPDINQINWNWISQYSSDGGTFVNLNDYADTIDLTQFEQSALDVCSVDGSLQAIPVSMTGRIFYWNKTTFDKAGIATPTSVDELLAAGQTFKEKLGDDYYPLCLGEYDRMILMTFYLESKYNKAWVQDGQLQYSQEEVQEGLEFIKSLEDNHVMPTLEKYYGDGAESIDKDTNWIDGHYAGIFEWDTAATKYEGSLEEGQELVVGDELTGMGDAKGGFSKVSLALAISQTTEHPEECAMLINFLLNEEEGVKLLGSERGVPLSKAALQVCTDNELLDAHVAEANGKVMDWVSFPIDEHYEDSLLKAEDGIYKDVFSGYSYGDYDVVTAAETLINGVNEAIGA